AGNDPRVPLSSSAGSPPPARKELLKAAREAALAGSPRSPRSRCSRETVASPLLLHRGAPQRPQIAQAITLLPAQNIRCHVRKRSHQLAFQRSVRKGQFSDFVTVEPGG